MPMKNYNNLKQLSTVYYFLPFSSDAYDSKKEIIKIDDGFVFKLSKDNNFRNFVRADIKACLEKVNCYKLDNEDNKTLSINSYAFLKDGEGNILNKVLKTNLKDAITLLDLWIYSFDKDNQFLVLQCCFDKKEVEEIETPLSMNQIINAHQHLLNNYFKLPVDDYEIKDSEILDILDSNFIHSFITISINEKEYTFEKGGQSLTSLAGLHFNFNNYPLQFISQFYMFEDDLNHRIHDGECIAYGVRNPYLEDPEKNIFQIKKFLSFSSTFGSTIIHYRENTNNMLDDTLIEETITRNNDAFNKEMFYDFILAINYRNRVKRHINLTGNLDYDTADKKQFERIRKEINVYYKETALYYFESVSQSDFINGWYKKLFERFEIEGLAKELENRLNAANTYISYKLDEARDKKRSFVNKTAFIFSTIASTVLAVFTLIQAVYAFAVDNVKLPVVISLGIVMVLCAIIGCIIILHQQNKIDK